jgi:hypothetical protein
LQQERNLVDRASQLAFKRVVNQRSEMPSFHRPAEKLSASQLPRHCEPNPNRKQPCLSQSARQYQSSLRLRLQRQLGQLVSTISVLAYIQPHRLYSFRIPRKPLKTCSLLEHISGRSQLGACNALTLPSFRRRSIRQLPKRPQVPTALEETCKDEARPALREGSERPGFLQQGDGRQIRAQNRQE